MHSILTQLGLDESEARVYLALLEIGPATVTQITKHADITRTLGYHVLEKLENYGLAKSVSRETLQKVEVDNLEADNVSPAIPAGRRGTSKKKMYVAENPKRLIHFVHEKKTAWDRKLEEAKQHLPEFLSLYAAGEKPTIQYIEGNEALPSVSRETFGIEAPQYSLVHIPADHQDLKEYVQDLEKQTEKTLYIVDKNKSVSRETFQNAQNRDKYRDISIQKLKKLSDFTGEIRIYDKVVHMLSLYGDKYISIKIKSPLVHQIMISLFDLAWESAESESANNPPLQSTRV